MSELYSVIYTEIVIIEGKKKTNQSDGLLQTIKQLCM